MWDLLSDVGGFHDGLVLLIAFAATSFAKFNFEKDYINGKFVEGAHFDRNINMQHDSTRF